MMTLCNVDGMTDMRALEGRPSGASSTPITVRVPNALHARIVALCEAEGISIAEWTRAALLFVVRREERQRAYDEERLAPPPENDDDYPKRMPGGNAVKRARKKS
jgi:hypothetical protein